MSTPGSASHGARRRHSTPIRDLRALRHPNEPHSGPRRALRTVGVPWDTLRIGSPWRLVAADWAAHHPPPGFELPCGAARANGLEQVRKDPHSLDLPARSGGLFPLRPDHETQRLSVHQTGTTPPGVGAVLRTCAEPVLARARPLPGDRGPRRTVRGASRLGATPRPGDLGPVLPRAARGLRRRPHPRCRAQRRGSAAGRSGSVSHPAQRAPRAGVAAALRRAAGRGHRVAVDQPPAAALERARVPLGGARRTRYVPGAVPYP